MTGIPTELNQDTFPHLCYLSEFWELKRDDGELGNWPVRWVDGAVVYYPGA